MLSLLARLLVVVASVSALPHKRDSGPSVQLSFGQYIGRFLMFTQCPVSS